MTIRLDWPPEIVGRLAEEARRKGLKLDDYLLQAVLGQQDARDAAAEEAELSRRRQEAAASIRELRKGNVLGTDLTVRDLIEEGRRF